MKRIALYTTCASCEGHGRVRGEAGGRRTELCPRCRGKGFVATKDGKAIIGLTRIAGAEDMLPEADV